MYLLFRTTACAVSGACKTWLPALRKRYGDDLTEIVDSFVPAEHRGDGAAEALIAIHGLGRTTGPAVVEVDEWAHSGRKVRRVGTPCGQCGGTGKTTTPRVPGRGERPCVACDGGTVWEGGR